MLDSPSIITRIAIGKAIGFLFGLVGLVLLPWFLPDAGWLLRWGILFWYTTLGAIIGVFGVVTYHPVLRLPMPWWFRAPLLGAWMNFVLTLFTYDNMQSIMQHTFGGGSPFWFVLEGALVGGVMGYLATRFGGEGRNTLDEQAD